MPPSPVVLSRRAALAGAVAAGTAACSPTTVDPPAAPASRPPRGTDPDVTLAATVLADERRVLDLVDAIATAHPRLEAALGTAREVHLAHIALLTDAVPADTATTHDPSPSSSPSDSATTPVPRRTRPALAALARAEDELSLTDKRSAFAAQSGAFSRVLASMAAAAAQQAVLVADLDVPGGRR